MINSACWIGILIASQVPPPSTAGAKVSELRREMEVLVQREIEALGSLATKLQKQGQTNAAQECRRLITPPPQGDGASRFDPLPEIVPRRNKALANIPVKGAAPEPWVKEMQAIRDKCGTALFELAQKAAAKTPPQFALADQALRAALVRLPEHPEIRRLLGFVPHEGGWATPFAVRQLREKKVSHPIFGWVDATWLPHLEQGELPAPLSRGQRIPQWLPAAQADELHGSWESRWKISTEHFMIHTDVPLSEAIAFGRQLETFYGLFLALFADVLPPEQPRSLASRFKDKAKKEGERPADPHVVYYFAGKDEYVSFLTPIFGPEIEKTLGRYLPPKKGQGKRTPAYLYRDPGGQLEASATLFHEVSHQLLFESGLQTNSERNVGNYWVFEGLGTYFETVSIQADGSVYVGGRGSPRIEEAKIRLVDRQELVPLESFVGLGQDAFNKRDSVHLHYAQAMALSVYLMQADQGEHREAFLDYVKDACRGRLKGDTGKSLKERVGISYSRMDQELIRYLEKHEGATVGTEEGKKPTE